ncbi:MAG: GTPase [Phycisphaerae bacterium]
MTPAATIASLQTPPGRGGIAVVAIRGPRARAAVGKVFEPRSAAPFTDGQLKLGHLVVDGQRLDEALLLRNAPDSLELHLHGGPAAVAAAMDALSAAGADTSYHAPACLPQAHPRWNNPAVGAELLEALPAALSARVVSLLGEQWSGGISRLASEPSPQPAALRRAADALPAMRRLLEPPEVVLLGRPNAGKSTLANALIGRDVSIVHDTPGTTRDWVREIALLRGLPVWLTDTAGLWETPDELDAEAVRRARRRARSADLAVLLEGGAHPLPDSRPDPLDWLGEVPVLRVASQCDRCPPAEAGAMPVSAVTAEGLDALRGEILRRLELGTLAADRGIPRAFTPRQGDLLNAAADALDAGTPTAAGDALEEIRTGRIAAL